MTTDDSTSPGSTDSSSSSAHGRGCRRASELASDRLDRRLTSGERVSLRFHLFICRYCRRFDRHLNRLRRLAQQAGDVERAPIVHRGQRGHLRLAPEAKQRIRAAIEAHRPGERPDDPSENPRRG